MYPYSYSNQREALDEHKLLSGKHDECMVSSRERKFSYCILGSSQVTLHASMCDIVAYTLVQNVHQMIGSVHEST